MTKLIIRLALVTLLSGAALAAAALPADAGEGRGLILRTR